VRSFSDFHKELDLIFGPRNPRSDGRALGAKWGNIVNSAERKAERGRRLAESQTPRMIPDDTSGGKEFRRQRFLSAMAKSNRLEKQTGKLNFPREGKHPCDSPRFTGSRISSLSFPPALSLSFSSSLLAATY